MQPVFFVSLFSLIFLMFSSMTNGITKNIMQANIERRENTFEMFKEIETVINKVSFQNSKLIDFSDKSYLMLDSDYLASKSSYSKSEISKDAWSRKIYLIKATEHVRIWGAPGGQYADAPISHFMLVSAGPNQVYDLFDYWNLTVSDGTSHLIDGSVALNEVKTVDLTDRDVVGDDIIIRFSNYDAMYNLWEKAEDLDRMVRDVALEYYKNAVDAFSPLIQLAQRDKDMNAINSLDNDMFADSLFGTNDFTPFKELQSGSSNNFKSEWNEAGSGPSNQDSLLHSMLDGGKYTGVSPARTFTGYRVAREYGDEFEINDPNTENDFKDSYDNVEFLYPSFDVLDYDINHNFMASGRGLENLGLPSIDALDPFAGFDGELDYDYDTNDTPNIITLLRTANNNGDTDKWNIKKEYVINGLGG